MIFPDVSKAFVETNNQKNTTQNPNNLPEKRITTLISFSMDEDNDEWDHDDQRL